MFPLGAPTASADVSSSHPVLSDTYETRWKLPLGAALPNLISLHSTDTSLRPGSEAAGGHPEKWHSDPRQGPQAQGL